MLCVTVRARLSQKNPGQWFSSDLGFKQSVGRSTDHLFLRGGNLTT